MSVVFGSIKGVSIGQIFIRRRDLSDAGVHAPLQAGIWGGANEGACSIVLSGGYEDDIDDLDFILYTGHGGQENKKQVADQQFTVGNQGLVLSCELKLPVRVIRGEQIPNGPDHGYRYDGLYYVQKYERVRGKSGFYVCRFHLKNGADIDDIAVNANVSEVGFKRSFGVMVNYRYELAKIEKNHQEYVNEKKVNISNKVKKYAQN